MQCAVYQVTWTGGTGPFNIRLLDSSQILVEEIAPSATSSPVQWTVNQPSGAVLQLSIQDSTGTTGITGEFTVQSSSNTACLSASSVTSSPTTAASTTFNTASRILSSIAKITSSVVFVYACWLYNHE